MSIENLPIKHAVPSVFNLNRFSLKRDYFILILVWFRDILINKQLRHLAFLIIMKQDRLFLTNNITTKIFAIAANCTEKEE